MPHGSPRRCTTTLTIRNVYNPENRVSLYNKMSKKTAHRRALQRERDQSSQAARTLDRPNAAGGQKYNQEEEEVLRLCSIIR